MCYETRRAEDCVDESAHHALANAGGLWLMAAFLRGNGVIHRTRKVIQGDDNGHVGRPCEVSLAPPCPELFCELRGLCRHSYFGPRTCSRSEKPMSSK
jgi:hypothetical protein